MADSNNRDNYNSTEDFVQLLNSFKGIEGDMKKMAEVLNEKTDKEKEDKQSKATKDQADKFSILAEKFDLFIKDSKEARKESADTEKTKESSNKSSIDSQRIMLEQMYNTLVRSNVDRTTGETEKDASGKESSRKEIKSLGDRLLDALDKKVFTKVGLPTAIPTARSIGGELMTLLLGGGALLGLGKLLGVPLADAVGDYLKSSWNVFGDFMNEKLGGVWTAIQIGLGLILAKMTGVSSVLSALVKATGKTAAWIISKGVNLFSKSAQVAEVGAVAAGGVAMKASQAAEAAVATGELAAVAKATTSTMGAFGRFMAGVGPILSAVSAKFNYDDYKKFEAAGLTEAAGMKKTAFGLDVSSGVLGTGALIAGGLGATTLAPVLLGGAAVAGVAGLGYSLFGDSKVESEMALKNIKIDTDSKLDNLITDFEKESDEIYKKAQQYFAKSKDSIKGLFDHSTEAKQKHQFEFSESISNLENAIDKSINTLMDWDQRATNPMQAIAEMIKGISAPKQSESPSYKNPITTRDEIELQRNRYRLKLSPAG